MITQELKAYIRAQLDAGVAKDAVKNTLSISGWSAQDVDDAFVAVESMSPVQSAAPITPSRLPVQNLMQPAPSRSRAGMWVIVIVVLLLVIAGGVFAAGYFGLIAVPYMGTTASSTPVATIPPPSAATVAPVVPPIIISPIPAIVPPVIGASTTTSTTTTTTTTSTTTTSNSIKSEIDKYGTDLFKLKQSVTTVTKTVDTKVHIVYTRTGAHVDSIATAEGGGGADIGSQISGSQTTSIDDYGTNLAALKEGVTVVDKTFPTKVTVIYTRTVDKVERKSTETGVFGTATITVSIDLQAKDQLPTLVQTMENGIATDCVNNNVSSDCVTGRKVLTYLKANCLTLTTNETVSACESAAVFSAF